MAENNVHRTEDAPQPTEIPEIAENLRIQNPEEDDARVEPPVREIPVPQVIQQEDDSPHAEENSEQPSQTEAQAAQAIVGQQTRNESIVGDFMDTVISDDRKISFRPNPRDSAAILANSADVADLLDKKNKKTDITLKWIYGIAILLLLAYWIYFVVSFANSQLEPDQKKIHHVSDTVFVTLLTTATANIIALPTIILKYLFPHK